MNTYPESSTSVSLQGWNVILCADSDGHLSVHVKHDDNSYVIDCTDEYGIDNREWVARYTTEKIESDYRAAHPEAPERVPAFDESYLKDGIQNPVP